MEKNLSIKDLDTILEEARKDLKANQQE